MKTLILFIVALASLSLRAANPAFTDFSANQFGTSGNKVVIKNGALFTNPVVRIGTITGDGSGLTNLTSANFSGDVYTNNRTSTSTFSNNVTVNGLFVINNSSGLRVSNLGVVTAVSFNGTSGGNAFIGNAQALTNIMDGSALTNVSGLSAGVTNQWLGDILTATNKLNTDLLSVLAQTNTALRAALAQTNVTLIQLQALGAVTNNSQIVLGHAGTVTLDLSALHSQADFTGCTGAVTFATIGLVVAHDYVLFGRNTNASNVTPTFPNWQFLGGAPPTITAGKAFVLSLWSRGTVDTNVWASYSEAQ